MDGKQRVNVWPLLRAGEAEQEQGLQLAKLAYAEEPYPSQAMELGVALLWLGKYAEAYAHFRSRIDSNPGCGDNDYGMAGAAKWCLGKFDEAVLEWRAGLKAKYARGSGLGVVMPMLLFFASVLKLAIVERDFAEKLLCEKTKDIRINNWPGPIALLILGKVSQEEFQFYCKGRNDVDSIGRRWLVQFYQSVLRYGEIGEPAFKQAMRDLTDMNQPEWQDENAFLSRIWCEEFFLARYEGDGTPG